MDAASDKQDAHAPPERAPTATAAATPATPTFGSAPGVRSGADVVGTLMAMGPDQRAAAVQRMQAGAGNRSLSRLLSPELVAAATRRQERHARPEVTAPTFPAAPQADTDTAALGSATLVEGAAETPPHQPSEDVPHAAPAPNRAQPGAPAAVPDAALPAAGVAAARQPPASTGAVESAGPADASLGTTEPAATIAGAATLPAAAGASPTPAAPPADPTTTADAPPAAMAGAVSDAPATTDAAQPAAAPPTGAAPPAAAAPAAGPEVAGLAGVQPAAPGGDASVDAGTQVGDVETADSGPPESELEALDSESEGAASAPSAPTPEADAEAPAESHVDEVDTAEIAATKAEAPELAPLPEPEPGSAPDLGAIAAIQDRADEAPPEMSAPEPALPGGGAMPAAEAQAAVTEDAAPPAGPEPEPEEPAEPEPVAPEPETADAEQEPEAAGPEVEAPEADAESATAEAPEADAESTAAEAPEAGTEPAESAEPDTATAPEDSAESIRADAGAEIDAATGTAEPPDMVGGGGGGGGAEVAAPTPAPPPDVSKAEPASALRSMANLAPHQIAGGLGGVAAATGKHFADQRKALADAPPEAVAGPAASKPEGTKAVSAGPGNAKAVAKAVQGPAVAPPKPKELKAPPPVQVAAVPTPAVKDTAEGKVAPEDAKKMQAAIRALPTKDAGLDTDPGRAPTLPLAGQTDPAEVDEQRAHLDQATAEAHAEGARDAATPLGEDQIAPTVKAETVQADVPAAPAAPTDAAGQVEAAADDEAASMVAQQEKGGEIQAAVAQGASDITAKKAEQAEKTSAEKAKSSEEIGRLETTHAEEEAQAKVQAKVEVKAQREEWSKEQKQLVGDAKSEAGQKAAEAKGQVSLQAKQAGEQAAVHHRQGHEEAVHAQEQGEREAEAKRKEGEQEGGGGFFGWIGSKVSSFFEGIKNGIKAAFDKARAAVKAAVQKAQQLANAVIDRAVQAVTSIIRAVGTVLIAIGDRLLAAFPGLRDRFRRAIQNVVAAAEAAVNRLAEKLKAAVKKALDTLGKALDAVLGLYERAYLAIVNAVQNVVKGAIDFAKKAIAALGVFAALVKDIAVNPVQWLRNLGAGVVDGIKNHLWKAIKTAVSGWFNQKVEEVVGLGKAVFNLLKKGGIDFAQVAKMVWQGVVAAIPQMVIMLLVEKLVSMIVPAAGAILLIIQGLQAAWGAIQRILAAIDAFVAFLKSVKSGNSGAKFAGALAASAVAVIEFIAVWLLVRLKGAAKGVGGKLKQIAQRIGKRLKAVGKKIVGGVKKVGRKLRRGASKLLNKAGRAGRAFKRKLAAWKKKYKDWKAKRKKTRQENAQKRLNAATQALRAALASQTMSGLKLKAYLMYLRVRYRLRSAKMSDGAERGEITLAVNPTTKTGYRYWRKKICNGHAKVYAFAGKLPQHAATGPDDLGESTTPTINHMIVSQAVAAYKNAVAQISAATPGISPSALGIRAGEQAERDLATWARTQGLAVQVGVFMGGGVLLGPAHGGHSSDARYDVGRMIIDFKLSSTSTRSKQHQEFVNFCVDNGYVMVYVNDR